MSELIAPKNFNDTIHIPSDYIAFPGTWNDLIKSHKPGIGYATYHTKILLKNSPQTLSLSLPHFYTSFALWINETPIAHNGQVGTSEKNTIPQWLPQTITFTTENDTLDMVIHASNFHHAKGGVREPILLGTPDQLNFKRQVAVSSNMILFAGLFTTATIFIFVFFFAKKEKSVILFAALCLSWAVRSVFSNLYILTSVFPDIPWELCVKIEYISLYLTM